MPPIILCVHCKDHGAARCDESGCSRAIVGEWSADQCRPCWLRLNRPTIRTPDSISNLLPCRYRGDATGVETPCGECGSRDKLLPLKVCELHGTCTERRASDPNVRCCRTCKDRLLPLPSPAVKLRHLLYHIMPTRNGAWRRNVDQLRQRWPIFTGRKIVSVVTGPNLESPAVVKAYLPPGCEVIDTPNVKALRENVSWAPMWEKLLEDAGDDDAVFYAHAKGVTHPINHPGHRWADAMYALCLDYWPEVASTLAQQPIAGPFFKQMRGYGHPSMLRSRWHYSGNYWWVRVGPFKQRWKSHPLPDWEWGVEAWPGTAFSFEEAGVLGPIRADGSINLYSEEYWAKTLAPALTAWVSSHSPTPAYTLIAPPPSPPEAAVRLSIIVATSGRDTLSRTIESITEQMLPDDELIVKRDATGDWGATPRQRAMKQATGTHLLFIDDDDVYLPGAFTKIREGVKQHPSSPLIFQIELPWGRLFKAQVLESGNVSTAMFCVPNVPTRLGAWTTRYQADFDFISSTVALYPPDALVWIPEVIAEARPSDPLLLSSR